MTFVEFVKLNDLNDREHDLCFKAWNTACSNKNKEINMLKIELAEEHADNLANASNFRNTKDELLDFITESYGWVKYTVETNRGAQILNKSDMPRWIERVDKILAAYKPVNYIKEIN